MSYFKDKVIVLTGATSGIGKSLTVLLQKEGAQLILAGRNFNALQSELPDGNNCKFIKADFNNDSDIQEFIRQINSCCIKVDILIHSAGIIHLGSLQEMPVNKLDEQYRINVRAPYLITQKILPLIKNIKGQIVFFNSTAGLQTRELVGQYSASKFALKAIADSLRLEVRELGINVLSVFLGATATPMQEKIQQDLGKVYNAAGFMSPDEIAERILLIMQNGKVAGVTDATIKDHNTFHRGI
jgi:short-subunit dehydrogenase